MRFTPTSQGVANSGCGSPADRHHQGFVQDDLLGHDVCWLIGLCPSLMSALDSINPSLTRYGRRDPAPVLPLREEPDLLTWLEASGRLVADEESSSPEVSTVEEEELSALMGEKEDYNNADEQNEEQWED